MICTLTLEDLCDAVGVTVNVHKDRALDNKETPTSRLTEEIMEHLRIFCKEEGIKAL